MTTFSIVCIILFSLFLIIALVCGLVSVKIQEQQKDLPRFRIVEITLVSGAKRYEIEEKGAFGYSALTKTFTRPYDIFPTTKEVGTFSALEYAENHVDRLYLEERTKLGSKEKERRVL